MSDNEKITNQLVNSLSNALKSGISESTIVSNVLASTNKMDREEHLLCLTYLYKLSLALLMTSVEGMNLLSQQRVNTLVDTITQLSSQKQLQEEKSAPKKMVFSSKEVMDICGIKGKNTVNKYFNDGIIKATKNQNNGRWSVSRKDLAEYLGTDEF